MFDQIGKNAKTALPALGDPILGVDVSSDGRWVIATCRTYLLLIDTLIQDGRYQGSLGFDRSFPADARPLPRRLQLRPHHVAYMESEVHFTPAQYVSTPSHAVSTPARTRRRRLLRRLATMLYRGRSIPLRRAIHMRMCLSVMRVLSFATITPTGPTNQLSWPLRTTFSWLSAHSSGSLRALRWHQAPLSLAPVRVMHVA